MRRDKWHGYVFDVSADEESLVDPIPIKSMGKFEHEAAAVHKATGIVYMTEDRHHSLFYRYIPHTPGKLHEGGRLQALAIDQQPSFMTHNWSREPQLVSGESLATQWINLSRVDSDENDLRLRGATKGAATFARGEGLCAADDEFVFTCTIGGPARLGQVFSYRPSPWEGQAEERDAPGSLTLLADADLGVRYLYIREEIGKVQDYLRDEYGIQAFCEVDWVRFTASLEPNDNSWALHFLSEHGVQLLMKALPALLSGREDLVLAAKSRLQRIMLEPATSPDDRSVAIEDGALEFSLYVAQGFEDFWAVDELVEQLENTLS